MIINTFSVSGTLINSKFTEFLSSSIGFRLSRRKGNTRVIVEVGSVGAFSSHKPLYIKRTV